MGENGGKGETNVNFVPINRFFFWSIFESIPILVIFVPDFVSNFVPDFVPDFVPVHALLASSLDALAQSVPFGQALPGAGTEDLSLGVLGQGAHGGHHQLRSLRIFILAVVLEGDVGQLVGPDVQDVIPKAVGDFGLVGSWAAWGQGADVALHEGEVALQELVAGVPAATGEVGEGGGDVAAQEIEVFVESQRGQLGVQGE